MSPVVEAVSHRTFPVIGERSGMVVAAGGCVALVGGDDPVAHATVVQALEQASGPADAVEALHRWFGTASDPDAPSCVVVALAGLDVVVHGDLEVAIDDGGDGPVRRLQSAPRQPITTRLSPASTLRVGSTGVPTGADRFDRLDAGVLAADGVVLSFEAVEDPPTHIEPEGHDVGDADEMGDDWPAPEPPPDPPTAAASVVERRPSLLGGRHRESPSIEGVMCARHHFNDPRARFCGQCGIAMHHASIVVVRRPRPVLGQLVFDTGETFQLSSDVVVGRNAGEDSLVSGGDARSLVPGGDTSALSRTHAEIRLRGWDAVLSDRGSLNGTFVWERSAQRWRRPPPRCFRGAPDR